jgi:hypothetical protein
VPNRHERVLLIAGLLYNSQHSQEENCRKDSTDPKPQFLVSLELRTLPPLDIKEQSRQKLTHKHILYMINPETENTIMKRTFMMPENQLP